MTLKSDAKSEEKSICYFDPSTQKSQKFAL